MLKNKKSLAVILSFVMLLALTCSAWAATGQIKADGAGVTKTINDDIETTAQAGYGAWAVNGGEIIIPSPGYDVTTTGKEATAVFANEGAIITMVSGDVKTTGDVSAGAYARSGSSVDMTASVTTSGFNAHAVQAYLNSSFDMTGVVKTFGGNAHGAYINTNSTLTMHGDIITSGDDSYGITSRVNSYVELVGNIETQGKNAIGAYANEASTVDITGVITTTGYGAHGAYSRINSDLIINGSVVTVGEAAHGVQAYDQARLSMSGDITTSGYAANGVYANQSADVSVEGNVTVEGELTYGLFGEKGSTISMSDGTLKVTDDTSFGAGVEEDSVINMTNVRTDTATLLATSTSGTLNAESSDLVGDILHGGLGGSAETLEINLTEGSTLEGAVWAKPGVGSMNGGVVDITLENSDWIVTGNSNTNGTLTGSGDSAVDYSQAPDGTVVIVDEIVGEIDFGLKVGDQLNVTNTDGNNSFSSSDQDVLGVTQNPDGSWSIISTGEGDADLTYTYVDPSTGTTKEVTTGVTSVPDSTGNTGSGSGQQSYSGGSSSNCNAGMGFWAMLSLLGMAVIQKRK